MLKRTENTTNSRLLWDGELTFPSSLRLPHQQFRSEAGTPGERAELSWEQPLPHGLRSLTEQEWPEQTEKGLRRG